MRNKKVLGSLLGGFLFIINGILAFIFVMISIMCVSNIVTGVTGEIHGYMLSKVVSGSMEPEYQIGDYVLIKEVPISSIKVGDKIAFEYDFKDKGGIKLVFHEVIEKTVINGHTVLNTKGTANDVIDAQVTDETNFKGVCIDHMRINILLVYGGIGIFNLLFIVGSAFLYKKFFIE